MPESQQVTLKIPRPLYERLKEIIANTGFRSVTEFAVYVLRDLASSHGTAERQPASDSSAQPALTPEEIEAIRRRLRSLGYL